MAATLVTLAAVTLSLYGIVHTDSHVINTSMCSNTILDTEDQPNGSYELVYFKRDCGPDEGANYQVSILRNGAKLGNEPGNLFISDNKFGANWLDSSTVTLTGHPDDKYKRKKSYKGIHIMYP
ncbi:hypothetical protein GCM10010917_33170 [Paenibacillus physcomitrellae]|uniref:Uncharacterized protein n=2 Tax=Paenibacillus physcomitrellae TaxID=1619311 RepID=A0ABQ1GKK3_9BACL|nr:hypothetical protein GCM10010917_33170 [Paenibacillus physcomitrellae]